MMVDDGVSLDQPPDVYESSEPSDISGSQLGSLQLISAKIFQLTEWMCKILVSQPTAADDEVVLIYHWCLDWYESFFAMLKTDESNSPFVFFVQ
ncbi:hypothetical protein PLIIFM63780_002139 [Purpureocillium lilacinum]|uniref:Uncharacterized protein n=1 Tax=Purpureocillium lilacinum TaxID=33203 RepID=A0ACC4D8V2_PURLI|nr:hypothetical protein PLIIFM63780_002139 [Purpureocillium lilacinum]